MKITDFLNLKAIKVDLDSTTKEDVLSEMVDALAESKDIGDKKTVLKALLERENLGSTGIGQGIAIPHGKTDKVDGLIAALGVSKKGVNFEALDDEPVYILFLLVAPKDAAGAHLKALAQISRLLRDTYFCELMRKCETAKDVFDLIAKEENRKA